MEGGYDPDSRRGFVKNTQNKAFDLIVELGKLKKEKDFCSGELYIKNEGDILILKRKFEKGSYCLLINNGLPYIYQTKNVILSHNYNNNVMEKYSFVIERRDENEG